MAARIGRLCRFFELPTHLIGGCELVFRLMVQKILKTSGQFLVRFYLLYITCLFAYHTLTYTNVDEKSKEVI